MLESNLMYYDEYMQFSFKDIHSSRYNLYIKNDIDDLKLYINSESSIEYTEPKYSNHKIVLGVKRPQRKIPISLVAHNVTRAQLLEITKWLKVGEIGAFVFDFAQDWSYDVIISSVSDPNLYPVDNNHFIASFNIEVSTLNGTSARNVQTASILFGTYDNTINDNNIVDTGDKDYWVNHENNKTSVYNNKKLLLPAMILQSFETEDTRHVNALKLLYLGDDKITLNVNYFCCEEGNNSVEVDHAISCNVNSTLQNFATSIKFNAKNNTNCIISFSQQENLFFVDQFLPEQQEARSGIVNLNTEYSHEILELVSPGAPRLVESVEQLIQYGDTAFPWMLCKPAAAYFTNYAEGAGTESMYPINIITPSICVDYSDITDATDLEQYIGYYFVFYDTIVFSSPQTQKFQQEVIINQYTEAI